MLEKIIQVIEQHPRQLLGLADKVKDYIYSNRGISDIQQLDYSLKNLLNPASLKDIDLAIQRLIDALINNQQIVIIGDYDCDGATSTALTYLSLKQLGYKKVDYIIPDRLIHGYGLSSKLVDLAVHDYGAQLIITVDNGISSVQAVDYANELGVDVIITDHHLQSDVLPNAYAIVNPNQRDCKFPSKNLAGVGVAYYVMKVLEYYIRCNFEEIAQLINYANLQLQQEINNKIAEYQSLNPIEQASYDFSLLAQLDNNINEFLNLYNPNFRADQYLDLVAIGTVADLAMFDYNNRILVEQGIRRIRAGDCCVGINALLKAKKIANVEFSTEAISFKIAPLINAIGRMSSMVKGVECLISNNSQYAENLAREMLESNSERSNIQAINNKSALTQFQNNLQDFEDRVTICLYNQSWHQGIIGLNCNLIKEKYWRPTFVFSQDDINPDLIKGSGRSIGSLHIKDCLDNIKKSYPDLIVTFGGHSGAAGVTIHKDDFETFSQIFDNEVRKLIPQEDIGKETIQCDLELPASYLTIAFAKELARMGPWGRGFNEPIFKGIFKLTNKKIVGKNSDTLLVELIDSNNNIHQAIKFNVTPETIASLSHTMELYYTITVNRYIGNEKLNIVIKHLKPL